MKITAAQRPFVLTFNTSGQSYPLTSEEVQRLLDSEVIKRATRNRVVLYQTNYSREPHTATLRPTTLSGGPAFIIERGTPCAK